MQEHLGRVGALRLAAVAPARDGRRGLLQRDLFEVAQLHGPLLLVHVDVEALPPDCVLPAPARDMRACEVWSFVESHRIGRLMMHSLSRRSELFSRVYTSSARAFQPAGGTTLHTPMCPTNLSQYSVSALE